MCIGLFVVFDNTIKHIQSAKWPNMNWLVKREQIHFKLLIMDLSYKKSYISNKSKTTVIWVAFARFSGIKGSRQSFKWNFWTDRIFIYKTEPQFFWADTRITFSKRNICTIDVRNQNHAVARWFFTCWSSHNIWLSIFFYGYVIWKIEFIDQVSLGHSYVPKIRGGPKMGRIGRIFHLLIGLVIGSMTSLLTHTVAHSTRPSFRPKTNNQPLNPIPTRWWRNQPSHCISRDQVS